MILSRHFYSMPRKFPKIPSWRTLFGWAPQPRTTYQAAGIPARGGAASVMQGGVQDAALGLLSPILFIRAAVCYDTREVKMK